MLNRKITAILAALMCCAHASAGPLDPPTGPITPTLRTLKEVEPRIPINQTNTPGQGTALYRISQPGSYYLTENLSIDAPYTVGIQVLTSNVTIDLSGFTIEGSASGVVGVRSSGSIWGLVVRNGTVTGCSDTGVDLGLSYGGVVRDIVATENGVGIDVGDDYHVVGCTAYNNADIGIDASSRCLVENCVADRNGTDGINANNQSTIRNCSAGSNNDDGISTSDASAILDCTVSSNKNIGVRVAWGCTVQGCTFFTNIVEHLSFGSYCRILENTVRGGAIGIHATGSRNLISDNHVTQGTTGFKVDGTNNLVIKNTCAEASVAAFNIVANNRVGSIVTMALSAAINGSSGGTAGTTDEAANFVY